MTVAVTDLPVTGRQPTGASGSTPGSCAAQFKVSTPKLTFA
jgi:hypothetical protein